MSQGDSSLPTALQSYGNVFCSQAPECGAAPESQHQVPLVSCSCLIYPCAHKPGRLVMVCAGCEHLVATKETVLECCRLCGGTRQTQRVSKPSCG